MKISLFENIRQSITKKLIYSYLLIVFIPVFFAGLYFTYYTRKVVEKDYLNAIYSNFQQIDYNISEKIESCKQNTNLIRWDSYILDFIQTENFPEAYTAISVSQEIIIPKLSMIKAQNKSIHSIRILHGNKSIPMFIDYLYYDKRINGSYWTDVLKRLDDGSRVYYDRISLESAHKEAVYFDKKKGTEEEVFTIYRPLYSINLKRFTGIIEVNILANDILEPIKVESLNKNEILNLINNSGKFLYNSSEDFEGVPLTKLMSIKGNIQSLPINGQTYLFVKKYISSIQSWIVLYIPQNKLNIQGSSKVLIVMALFVCFITLSIISFFMSKLLLGNLVKLSNVINTVKHGNLDVTADIKSTDEIGELALNFNEMISNIKNLMESVREANLAEKEAIYKALDNQIKPHFLCNALDMIRVTAENNNYHEISYWIGCFMNYFMYNSSKSNKYVSLKDELKNAADYIEIYNLIGKKKVEYTIQFGEEIDGRLSEYHMLKLILQPIVENAIVHGFSKKDENCCIFFEIYLKGDKLIITLEDNGGGIPEERLNELRKHLEQKTDDYSFSTSGKGIGLKNIHERMKLNFGDAYQFCVQSRPGVGTQITIEILEDCIKDYKGWME